MLARIIRPIFLTGAVLILFGICLEVNTPIILAGVALITPTYLIAHYAANHSRKAQQ